MPGPMTRLWMNMYVIIFMMVLQDIVNMKRKQLNQLIIKQIKNNNNNNNNINNNNDNNNNSNRW